MLGGRHDPSGHERCPTHHPVQKQGIKTRLQKLSSDLPSQTGCLTFWDSHPEQTLQVLAERVYLKSQCGIRKNRPMIDMVFTLRLLQEKYIEQNKPLYIMFIDLTNAFDTVSRTGLYKVLEKTKTPPNNLHLS